MTKSNSLRALGLSAAIIVGAGGSLAASPAIAAPEALPTAGAAFKKFEDQAFDAGAAGVGTNAAGEVVLAVDETSDSVAAVEEVVGDATNVKYIMLDGPIEAAKQDEVVGGSGYMIPKSGGGYGLCSLAFSAWTPKGDDAFITAGHCGEVGENVKRSKPASDVEFNGGEQDPMDRNNYHPVVWDDLGTFTNSQFGAKDPYADDATTATDVATIDKTNDNLKALPAVTKWGAAAKNGDDLAADATVIKSVGKAKAKETVLKSGRTTGLTEGEVMGDMVFGVADPDDPQKARYVKGFMATHTMRQGDSGGAWFSSNGEALGISSAISMGQECSAPGQCKPGTHDYSFVADLEHAVSQTPGYEVKLYVNAPGEPKATAAGGSAKAGSAQAPKPVAAAEYKVEVAPGQKIEGPLDADATIEAVEGSETPENLTSADGKYSFTAPNTAGTYTYKLQARKGKFNVSEPITIIVTVKEDPTEDPTDDPTEDPTDDPTEDPTDDPTEDPTQDPTEDPTQDPTEDPSDDPAERALSIDPENIKATDFVKKDAVTIAASGCTPGTEANLEVKPRGSNVTGHTDTATVDEDGNVGFSVYGENADMPNAYVGDYDVTVSCDGGDDLTGSFTVTKTGGKDDDGKGGDDKKGDNKNLPRTGSEALGSLGAAAALIAGGAGLYVLARRRKN